MTVKLRAHHDKGTSWEINGEYVLEERQGRDEILLSGTRFRRREWRARVDAIVEDVARATGVFRRSEYGIDVLFVVIESSVVEAVRAELGRRRLDTTDYESLTIDHARRAVLAEIDTKGGHIDWIEIDEEFVAKHFPLGYRAREAIEDLERSGALRIVRAKGVATLWMTDVGGTLLRP